MEEIEPANSGEEAEPKKDGAGANPKKDGGGTTPKPDEEIKVPRRNADYWEAAKKRRDTQRARADFFKSSKKDEDGNPINEDDAPLTRKEYEELRKREHQEWEEEQDDRLRSQNDNTSVSSFLSDPKNESFRKYEKQARAYLKEHPYYPLEGIFRDLAYDDALAEGAAKGVKADEKAKRNTAGGGSGEPQSPAKSNYDSSMDSKGHAEFKKKLKSGKVSFTQE